VIFSKRSKKLNGWPAWVPSSKMPGITHRDAKLGKGKKRAQMKMDRLVVGILNDESEMPYGACFAIVTKIVGNGGLQIRLDDGTDTHGKVYSQVLRKARCWEVGVIVIVSPGIRKGEYEIHAMVDRADAKRKELVPTWMIAIADGASVEEATKAEAEPFIFVDEPEKEPEKHPEKKDKKDHRKQAKKESDEEIDIEGI